MQGLKEITISFTIGITGLTAWMYARHEARREGERRQETSVPTNISGRSEDPALDLNWGLKAIGLSMGQRTDRLERQVIVAVIDTGCDASHPDLRGNLWTNPGESGLDENGNSKATNGVDDDGNGLADDIHGWNFVDSSPDLMDEHGHGTHIAGIVAGRRGVAPGVSLMILKYYDPKNTGVDNLKFTVAAIRYAVRNGAQIINYSGGGVMKSAEEEAALGFAAQKGVLVVAAAGNDGMNSDFMHFYPAGYDLPNILSVGATDRADRPLPISNYGIQTVDVAAPGKNIYSTLPNGQHGYMTGTSQATAFVTGVAALALANRPEFTRDPAALIMELMLNSSSRSVLRDKNQSGSLVSANWALTGQTRVAASLPAKRAPAQN
ncbi:MAG TPA: S8 family peptidase [Bdellovibrionales bacterium]|nr:S8 family peptidase [Bdellovibrionales bacterium]